MDETKLLIEEFKKLQPFKDRVIKDPFGNEIIDVESINSKAFEKVINALKAVKESKKPDILILQGEPGSGKSHLLARIYRHAETERFLFALYNPLIVKSGATYSALLKSLFDSFERKHSELKAKPINHIRGEIIRIGLENYNVQEEPASQTLIKTIKKPKRTLLPNVLYEEFKALQSKTQEKLRKFIADEVLLFIKEESNFNIGKKYLKAIIEALVNEEKYPVLRELISEGSLTKEDAEILNLTTGFVINEDIAFEIIQSIFLISPFPILLSIDQIEHFDKYLDENGIIRFLDDLYKLVSNTRNVLLLLSAQTAVFRKWNSFLPEHLKDRFSNVASLEGMKAEEGLEIIKARNLHFFEKLGYKPEDPFFPFDKDELLIKIKEHKLRSPRKVLELAESILEGTITYERTVKHEFENLISSQIYNKDDFEDALGELLATLLHGTNLYPHGKKLVIKVNDAVIGIDNSKNYYSTVRKLVSSLKKKGLKKAILVRDEKIPIRAQTKSMKLIEENNIVARYYKYEEGKELMATQKLISLTESRDLDLNLDEVKEFSINLLKKFFGNLLLKDTIKEPSTINEPFNIEKNPRKERREKLVDEIVARIKDEFESGKINIARLSQYLDLKDPFLIHTIVERLKLIPSLKILEHKDGEIFIAKKTL